MTDHLQLPGSRQIPALVIPVYGEIEYDGGDFESYLERLGIDEETLLQSCFVPNSVSTQLPGFGSLKVKSILQEWLFFGVAISFGRQFNLKFLREDFICKIGQEEVINTGKLCKLASNVVDAVSDHVLLGTNTRPILLDILARLASTPKNDDGSTYPPIAIEKMSEMWRTTSEGYRAELCRDVAGHFEDHPQAERVVHLLRHAMGFLEKLELKTANPELTKVWDTDWWLSAQILSESLFNLGRRVMNLAMSRDQLKGRETRPMMENIWTARARASNHCLTRFQGVVSDSYSAAYLASSFIRSGDATHSDCSLYRCCAPQGTFETLPQHRSTCDGHCGNVTLNDAAMENLLSSLEQGSYCVLKPSVGQTNSIQLEAVDPMRNNISYLAYSHVWSHGLGNPTANSLPVCQVRTLCKIMVFMNLSAFWIDTLCVPLTSPHRRLAISRMGDIYTRAEKVVVLDRDLLESRGNAVEQQFLLILSDWFSRLWTLQESLLADARLFVAFYNDIVSIQDLIYHTPRMLPAGSHDFLIRHEASSQLRASIRGYRFVPSMLALARSLHSRATTKAEDEALCLCTLMGHDTLKLPRKPLLSDVFATLETVNAALIFVPGRRSQLSGFRWSPLSFLSAPRHRNYDGLTSKKMPLTKDGLQVQSQSWCISHEFWFEPYVASLGSRRHFLITNDEGDAQCVFTHDHACSDIEEQVSPRKLIHAALILEVGREDWEATQRTSKSTYAALVSNVREAGGKKYAHFETHVVVEDFSRFEASHDVSSIEFITVTATYHSIEEFAYEAEWWCVD